jgi:hypothetical protein
MTHRWAALAKVEEDERQAAARMRGGHVPSSAAATSRHWPSPHSDPASGCSTCGAVAALGVHTEIYAHPAPAATATVLTSRGRALAQARQHAAWPAGRHVHVRWHRRALGVSPCRVPRPLHPLGPLLQQERRRHRQRHRRQRRGRHRDAHRRCHGAARVCVCTRLQVWAGRACVSLRARAQRAEGCAEAWVDAGGGERSRRAEFG